MVQPNASAWTQGNGYDQYNRLSNIVSVAGNFISQYWSGGDYSLSDRELNLGLGGPDYYSDRRYINNEYDLLDRLTSPSLKNTWGTVLNQHS